MNTYRVQVNDGSAVLHSVVVRARSHEEAEKEALILLGIKYESVRTILTTPQPESV